MIGFDVCMTFHAPENVADISYRAVPTMDPYRA